MLVLFFALAIPAAAHAQDPQRLQGGARIDFSVEDADLPELVRAVSQITGRRFILAIPARTIRASVIGEEPVSAADVYSAFLSILRMNGLTVVRSGRYEVIVTTEEIERRPIPLVIGR